VKQNRNLLLGILLGFVLPSSLGAMPGDVVKNISSPGPAPTGLAYDGLYLWLADRLTDSLYAIEPASGEVAKVLAAPGFVPLGLTWDGSSCGALMASRTSSTSSTPRPESP
jgi:hypothetical protein